MTPAQVAAHLQGSERRVVKWLREGQLLGVKRTSNGERQRCTSQRFWKLALTEPPRPLLPVLAIGGAIWGISDYGPESE
jgi:hypothetical protein